MVEKEILEDRAYDRPLRRSLLPYDEGTIIELHRGLQPPFNTKEHPWRIDMHPHRFEEQLPVDAVEKGLDVRIKNIVVPPASLSRLTEGVLGRFARPLPIRVRIEALLRLRLYAPFHHRLSDAVRDRRYA